MTSPTDPFLQGRAESGGARLVRDAGGLGSGRSGAIILARHGEPALSRRLKLDARGYDRWWAAYEAGGILPGQTPPAELLDQARRAGAVFTSIRPRAIETAKVLVGERSLCIEPMLVEAPLPAPRMPGFLRLSPRAWGVISRALWWLGHHRGQETRTQARARARQAAARLIDEAGQGEDVLVLAHGFFNAMVGGELGRRGWRCVQDRGFRYWSARRFERG